MFYLQIVLVKLPILKLSTIIIISKCKMNRLFKNLPKTHGEMHNKLFLEKHLDFLNFRIICKTVKLIFGKSVNLSEPQLFA